MTLEEAINLANAQEDPKDILDCLPNLLRQYAASCVEEALRNVDFKDEKKTCNHGFLEDDYETWCECWREIKLINAIHNQWRAKKAEELKRWVG